MSWNSLLLGSIFLFHLSYCEVIDKSETIRSYSRAVANMDILIRLNEDLAKSLEEYGEALIQKSRLIRWGIFQMLKGLERKRKISWNTINTYSLIRHMQADWLLWQKYLDESVGLEQLSYIQSRKSELPSNFDFVDAAEGIRKMQKVYQLSATDIANGLLDGATFNSTLSVSDCWALAQHCINLTHWKTAEQWILAGMKSLNKSNRNEIGMLSGPNKVDLYGTLAQVHVHLNKPEVALATFETALQHFPHNASLFQEYQNLKKKVLIEPKIFQTNSSDLDDTVYDMECCNGLCKTARNLQLYCVYDSKTSPFLRLAAVKKEFLSLDPYIVIFHNVISEKEILRIRRASKDQLTVSTIMNYDSGEHVVDSYRTSKSVWYPSDTNDLTWRLTNLVGDVSGMEMKTSERFQVINYGIAGIFEAHTDSLLLDHHRYRTEDGDRIATTIFWLSEVPQGGATVFTKLNLTVFPQPGSAIFWYNLDNQGNEDKRTDHAGCPVIVGSKWIMTKWVSHFGQEFRKPCYKLDYPIPFYLR